MSEPRRSLGNQILSDVTRRLDANEWPAGAKLPSIRVLAREYGVTALTMSRVIRRLAEAGRVRTIPGKGVYALEIPRNIEEIVPSDMTWQLTTLRRRPFRSFTVQLPRSVPDDTIDLATGTMSNTAISNQSIRRALRNLATSYEERPVSERSTQGELPLREWIANYLGRQGVRTTSNDILVVSSTHQAFRIIGAAVIDPGDVVLIEVPADPIVIGVFEAAGAQCIGVPLDDHGMLINRTEELIGRYRPKLVVTCSSGQVPTGVTMSVDRRLRLVELARATRTLVVEYDNSNEVYYDAPPPMPIKRWASDGTVAYIRDFARITAAGLRLGCLTIEGPIFDRLLECKRRDDLFFSTVAQHALLAYVQGRNFEQNLVKLREFYGERRTAALDALQTHMPAEVTWFKPGVGFHIWVNLPPQLSARALVQEAAARGVIVAPSEIFSIDGKLDSGIRITFSDNSPEIVVEGIRRAAETITIMLHNAPSRDSRRLFEIV